MVFRQEGQDDHRHDSKADASAQSCVINGRWCMQARFSMRSKVVRAITALLNTSEPVPARTPAASTTKSGNFGSAIHVTPAGGNVGHDDKSSCACQKHNGQRLKRERP